MQEAVGSSGLVVVLEVRREIPSLVATGRCERPSTSTLCRSAWTWSTVSILSGGPRSPMLRQVRSADLQVDRFLERRVDHFPSGASTTGRGPDRAPWSTSSARLRTGKAHGSLQMNSRNKSDQTDVVHASRPTNTERTTFNYPSLPKYIAAAGMAFGFIREATSGTIGEVAQIGNVAFPYYGTPRPMAAARQTFVVVSMLGVLMTGFGAWLAIRRPAAIFLAPFILLTTPLFFYDSWT